MPYILVMNLILNKSGPMISSERCGTSQNDNLDLVELLPDIRSRRALNPVKTGRSGRLDRSVVHVSSKRFKNSAKGTKVKSSSFLMVSSAFAIHAVDYMHI